MSNYSVSPPSTSPSISTSINNNFASVSSSPSASINNNLATPIKNSVSSINNNLATPIKNSVASINNNLAKSVKNSVSSINNNLDKSIKNSVATTPDSMSKGTLLMIIIIIFVLALIAYFISKSYRVGTAYENLKMYDNYFILSANYLQNETLQSKPLKNFYVASAFRPYMAINQYFDYTSTKLIQKVIMSGARFVYMDVYNSNLKFNPSPVVSNGFEKGNWKLTLNTTTFDEMCKVIAYTAFNAGYCNNYNDPFFLALNLNVNNNVICLNKIRNIIYKHFKHTLLPPEFGSLKQNLAETSIKKLMSKLVLITSSGYQDSQLTELINGSWEDKSKINLINYGALDPKASADNTIKLQNEEVVAYNKKALTIVTPNIYDFFTMNYNSSYEFDAGCQFICVNYQKKNNISDYISRFKTSSFVLKPDNLI